ncbi:MAG TPA: hypothetical protein VFF68_09355 [Anaerolineaceae bacterium]|nr:hypothetical protein [Anaerolineaceae bacterium]
MGSDRSPIAQVDWRAVLVSVRLPAFYWVLSVVLVTVMGYPGVACMTPVAWLLALVVAKRCLDESHSDNASVRLWEAGLAGGLLGLIEGLAFVASAVSSPGLQPADRATVVWISLGITVVGLWVTVLLAAMMALLVMRRRS